MYKPEFENFIIREARLADEGSYEEWLSLWTEDAVYWVPCGDGDTDPTRSVSLIYDDRARLEDRVARLASGAVLAQDRTLRLRRLISNFEIVAAGDMETKVESNFIIVEVRGLSQYMWCGRSVHILRKLGEELKIARKTVFLVNADQEMPSLHFLV
jgi:3-phenylpropionate/cinnamic acid dioxygenase small subunit